MRKKGADWECYPSVDPHTSYKRPRVTNKTIRSYRILNNVHSEHDSFDGWTMWNLFIPTLGKRYILPPYVHELENRLGDALFEIMPINANVFPYLGVADLRHDMSYVISTLLVGEKIWFIYPPLAHNLSVMKDAYESIPTLAEHEYRIFKWYKELKDGVTFV
jgi:hypothetical protein